MIKEVERRLKEQKFIVTIEPSVAEMIVKTGIDKSFGARPLRRKIKNLVEDKISEEILEGNLKKNQEVILNIDKDKVFIENKM